MLRASADAASVVLNLRAIGDPTQGSGRDDADALLAFTSALVQRMDDLDEQRLQLIDVLGADAVVPASGSAGNFEMMNRILDGAGIPVPESTRQSIGQLVGLNIT